MVISHCLNHWQCVWETHGIVYVYVYVYNISEHAWVASMFRVVSGSCQGAFKCRNTLLQVNPENSEKTKQHQCIASGGKVK